jgi:peptidoglycan/LPS O-acetylase OafA/YrhL
MSEEPTSSTQARSLSLLLSPWLMVLLRDNASPPGGMPEAQKSHAAGGKISFLTRLSRGGSPATQSAYRADIDGLRAIAVFGVILMHAGISAISGGFLGVDVFFVISGYLVHQQVTARLRTQTFSLSAFYGRRIRRTFPALYLIAALSLLAGVLILMPGDLSALAKSAIAAALGASNILFATQTGYFDHDAITKPLLHTWSLGVEEQYYLLAPLIPFALYQLSDRTRSVVLLGLLVSDLVFCIIMQNLIPAITFFMMPPRLWEFLIGSLIAEGFIPTIKRQWIAEIAAALALAALLASMLWISDAYAHPGVATLVPCLATAALIHIGGARKTFVSRLLGAAPLAFCGLISYSLYLWHWPLIVFARYMDLPSSPMVFSIGAGLLLALSVLSWKYVETPFRDPSSVFKRRAVPILLAGLCILAATSSAIIFGRGLPGRFPADVIAVTSYYDYDDRRDFREGTCFITTKYGDVRAFDRKDCLQISATKPNYLLIGDSHAAHFWVGFSQVFQNVHILQATASGCKPVLATQGLRYCVDLMHEALVDFLPRGKLDGVIFSAAWNNADVAPLKATLDYAKRFVPHVIILGNIPSHEIDLPNLLGRSLVEHRPDLILANQSPSSRPFNTRLKAAISPDNYVSLVDLLCPENRCIVYAAEHVPLQFDTAHLTTEGSIFVAKKLAQLPLFAPLVEGRDESRLK